MHSILPTLSLHGYEFTRLKLSLHGYDFLL